VRRRKEVRGKRQSALPVHCRYGLLYLSRRSALVWQLLYGVLIRIRRKCFGAQPARIELRRTKTQTQYVSICRAKLIGTALVGSKRCQGWLQGGRRVKVRTPGIVEQLPGAALRGEIPVQAHEWRGLALGGAGVPEFTNWERTFMRNQPLPSVVEGTDGS
jgi:hypothetical protein